MNEKVSVLVPSPPAPSPAGEDIREALGLSSSRRWKKAIWIAIGVLLVATAAIAIGMRYRKTDAQIQWREATIDRGDIVVKVSATGTLEPERSVSIGAEVSGRVDAVLVDHNDTVKRDQVLVRLELTTFNNTLREAKASSRAGSTEVKRARATLNEAETTAKQAERLALDGFASEAELLSARTKFNVAKASVQSALLQRSIAKIRVEQAEDSLSKAVIKSPIDGIVLRRSVEPGNVIAATLQAPELFVLAEDLSSMELQLDIDEADVGQLKVGQAATFNVDAWPGRTFEATVSKVYFAPKTSASVVTYTAELIVANDEQMLRPGMTATAEIVTQMRKNVLRVPNTAMRFTPPSDEPEEGEGFQMGPPATSKKRARVSAVWMLEEGVAVQKNAVGGVTDGYFTEVFAENGFAEGAAVLIGIEKTKTR